MPPSIPVEILPPPQPKPDKVIKEAPENTLPPPPPAPAPAPSFDPFGDLPPPAEPLSKEPPPPPQPQPEAPVGNDPFEIPDSSNFPAPPTPNTFDPFGDEVPDESNADPFKETQPASESPLNDPPHPGYL